MSWRCSEASNDAGRLCHCLAVNGVTVCALFRRVRLLSLHALHLGAEKAQLYFVLPQAHAIIRATLAHIAVAFKYLENVELGLLFRQR